MAIGNIPGIILLLAATILLILASVSTPVNKHFYFLQAHFNGVSVAGITEGRTSLNLGMWGYCLKGAVSQCSKRHLGYNLSFLESLLGTSNSVSHLISGLSKALILHPIAAGVTFIALLFALSTHIIFDILASLFAFIAFIITLAAFVIDLVLWLEARHRINKIGNGTHAKLGNAFWFVIAAFVAQFFAMFLVCLGGLKRRKDRRRRDQAYGGGPAMSQTSSRRGLFGRRKNNAVV